MNIKAVLFDLDGTLIDSERLVKDAMRHALRETGNGHISESAILQTTGMAIEAAYASIAPDTDNALLCTLHREYQKINIQEARTFPGAKDTLEALTARGIICCICTSRTSWIPEMLSAVYIDHFFKTVVGRADVENPKPHPESLYKALASIGVSASEAVMVGDSFADIGAGRNARVAKTIAFIPHEMSPRMKEAAPDIIITSLPELLTHL